jgi:hypothetical protein
MSYSGSVGQTRLRIPSIISGDPAATKLVSPLPKPACQKSIVHSPSVCFRPQIWIRVLWWNIHSAKSSGIICCSH